jgi:hypothetical protein
VVVDQLARMPGTALHRAVAGEYEDWSNTNVLLARAVHALEVANWQRGADEKEGKSLANYPAPIQLPGQEPWVPPNQDRKRFGGPGRPIEQMKKWLGWG